jgi:uncharacterized protein YndB with AHSA1/START domain
MTASDSARDIRITRVYDAPLARVWDAFTDDAQASQWWGPRGFTITTHSKDLRPGGTWVYTMHGPDGTDWPNFTRYHEVEHHARLMYDHGASSEDSAPMFRMTVLFRELGDRTELALCMTLPSPEAAQQARVFVKAAGGNATWDRLAEYLEAQSSRDEVFVINRSFDAPIDIVFDMFATPEHFAAWLPPVGFTMTFRRATIAPDGEAVFAMTNGEFTMYGRLTYHVVERPHRLVYSQVFVTEDEQPARYPGDSAWPESMTNRVELTTEGPAQTRVTIRTSVNRTATPAELAAFVAERGGMTKGWTGSFDKLEAVLAEAAI